MKNFSNIIKGTVIINYTHCHLSVEQIVDLLRFSYSIISLLKFLVLESHKNNKDKTLADGSKQLNRKISISHYTFMVHLENLIKSSKKTPLLHFLITTVVRY